MNLPDFLNLPLAEVAGFLFGLAFVAFLAGIGSALKAGTTLWTYADAFLKDSFLKATVLVATATIARGIPGVAARNDALGLIFLAAASVFIAAQLASIAKNLGAASFVASLPGTRNVSTADVLAGKPPTPEPAKPEA